MGREQRWETGAGLQARPLQGGCQVEGRWQGQGGSQPECPLCKLRSGEHQRALSHGLGAAGRRPGSGRLSCPGLRARLTEDSSRTELPRYLVPAGWYQRKGTTPVREAAVLGASGVAPSSTGESEMGAFPCLPRPGAVLRAEAGQLPPPGPGRPHPQNGECLSGPASST